MIARLRDRLSSRRRLAVAFWGLNAVLLLALLAFALR